LAPLERAYAYRKAHKTDPIQLAETQFAYARALWDSGRDRARAKTLAREARENYEKIEGTRNSYFSGQQVEEWLADHCAPSIRR
jgi:hypothetical protein